MRCIKFEVTALGLSLSFASLRFSALLLTFLSAVERSDFKRCRLSDKPSQLSMPWRAFNASALVRASRLDAALSATLD